MLQKLKENKQFIAFIIFFIFAFWFANIVFTVQHESIHKELCKKFAGENVTTYTNYSFGFTSGDTFCSNISSRRGLELQMQTDIVGYHVEALIYVFFIGMALLVGYWELRRGGG